MTTTTSPVTRPRTAVVAGPESLLRALGHQLESRVLPGKPVIVRLDGDQKAYRFDLSIVSEAFIRETALRIPSGQSHGNLGPWQYLGPLPKLLDTCLRCVDVTHRTPKATLPIIACRAWPYLAALIDSLEAETDATDGRVQPPATDAMRFEKYVRATEGSLSTAQQMARAVTARATKLGHGDKRPTVLQLRNTPAGVQVEWLDRLQEVTHSEFLAEFLESAADGVVGFSRTGSSLERDAMQHLESASPLLASAVSQSLQSGKPVTTLVGTYGARQELPMSVWVFVQSNYEDTGIGRVFLSAHRNHDEFILEGLRGDRYYFPPCLLGARLSFSGFDSPRVYEPLVIQPSGGYRWNHPYSGCLHGDAFAATGSPICDPAMGTASDQAKRLFPGLASRVSHTQSRDICLEGVWLHLETVRTTFHSTISPIFRPDVLGLVNSLHDIAKTGLTRAHERNVESTPRSEMTTESMYCPLNGHRVTGNLARRTFPYWG